MVQSYDRTQLNVDGVRAAKRDALTRQAQAGMHVTSPLDTQEGGDHYKKLKIQPAYYNWANKIPFIEGCCIKYLTRWRDKGGIEDLRKSMHLHDLLIYFETTPMELIEQSKIIALERAVHQADNDFAPSPRAPEEYPQRREYDASGEGSA